MMQQCDTLLMVGTNYPYAEFLPPTGHARAVQIDMSPAHLGVRYPTEVNLWGDSKATLQALLPMLNEQTDKSWQSDIADWMRKWESEAHEAAMAVQTRSTHAGSTSH